MSAKLHKINGIGIKDLENNRVADKNYRGQRVGSDRGLFVILCL